MNLKLCLSAVIIFTSIEAHATNQADLNDIESLPIEAAEKKCESIPSSAYVSGLTDGAFTPFGKTYYYKSMCYKMLAYRTGDAKYCDKVTERHALLDSGASVSKKTCLDEVKKKNEAAQQRDAAAAAHQQQHDQMIALQDVTATKAGGDWLVTASADGKLGGKYILEVAVSGKHLTGGVVYREELQLTAGNNTLNATISAERIAQAVAEQQVDARLFNVSVSLYFIDDNHHEMLSNIKNINFDNR